MSRFSAVPLDLSRLPAPNALRDLDFKAIEAERLASLKARFAEVGIAWDVDRLKYDPAVILQIEDANRELLGYGAINDAVRAVLPPFATGGDLDQIALRYGVIRLPGEDNTRLRARVLLAPEAMSCAGTKGAYIFHAATAALAVYDVGVDRPAPGHVDVTITEAGGAASADLVDIVRAWLFQDTVKPFTDILSVSAAGIVSYSIAVRLLIPAGPDPLIVKANAEAALAAEAATLFVIGRSVPLSAITAAARVPNVRDVIIESPVSPISVTKRQAAKCAGTTVTVEVVDD